MWGGGGAEGGAQVLPRWWSGVVLRQSFHFERAGIATQLFPAAHQCVQRWMPDCIGHVTYVGEC